MLGSQRRSAHLRCNRFTCARGRSSLCRVPNQIGRGYTTQPVRLELHHKGAKNNVTGYFVG